MPAVPCRPDRRTRPSPIHCHRADPDRSGPAACGSGPSPGSVVATLAAGRRHLLRDRPGRGRPLHRGRHGPQRPHRGRRRPARRLRLLAGGGRRRGVHLRRGRLLRLHRAHSTSTSPSWTSSPPPTGSGTGRWAPTAGCSPSATPGSSGPPARVHLNRPIVGIESTPDGGGYWLVSADGGVFAFGDAAFHGSAMGLSPTSAIVGLASTPDGSGYWEAAANGAVFAFGDAAYAGGSILVPADGGHQRPRRRLPAGGRRTAGSSTSVGPPSTARPVDCASTSP